MSLISRRLRITSALLTASCLTPTGRTSRMWQQIIPEVAKLYSAVASVYLGANWWYSSVRGKCLAQRHKTTKSSIIGWLPQSTTNGARPYEGRLIGCGWKCAVKLQQLVLMQHDQTKTHKRKPLSRLASGLPLSGCSRWIEPGQNRSIRHCRSCALFLFYR